MSEAKWTLAPTTERAIARERSARRATRRWGWLLFLSSLGLCPVSCLSFGVGDTVAGTGWFLVPIAALLGAAVEYLRRSTLERRLGPPRIAALREEYGAVGGWLVDLMVLQGAAPTGRDVGVVWFEDDRLLFAGERTSFALSRGAVTGPLREGATIPGLRHPTSFALEAATAGGRLSLGLLVIPPDTPTYPASQGSEAFRRALRGWLASRSEGAGGLPPLAIGPEASSPGGLLNQALAVTVLWPALVLTVVGTGVATDGAAATVLGFLALMALLGWPAAWMPRLCWRAWRDRRRLDKLGS